MPVSLGVLLAVFILIAIRQVGRFRLPIWLIMSWGACVVLISGQITLKAAFFSVDPNVMLFLFGMFVIGEALEESGYLAHLSYHAFRKMRSPDHILFLILFGAGTASAFLMNDTLAIIGTPLVLWLAERYRLPVPLALLALAFAVTIGSAMSPIGNPQNLLIALGSRMSNPFITFFKHLFLPTMLNLFLAFGVLKFFFRKHFKGELAHHHHGPPVIRDAQLARLSRISLFLVVGLVLLKILLVFFGIGEKFWMPQIALISMLPVLWSRSRFQIIRSIHWNTLVFFAAMFILMQSVWDSGFFQSILQRTHLPIESHNMVLAVSVLLSQLISNVPLAALYLPMLLHSGASEKAVVALAAGSTIAGNLLILGAASNIIIIHKAEEEGETLGFLEFAKVGIPLTTINILVYWLFLSF